MFVVAIGIVLLILAVKGNLGALWDGIQAAFTNKPTSTPATSNPGNPPAGVGH